MTAVRRQVADPSLGVGDFMRILRAEMSSCNSWDLFAYLGHPTAAAFSWKTAPHPGWMTKTSNLCYRFCSVAPNGIVSSSKLKQAILKLNHEQKINFTRFHEEDFADKCDYRIRILLSQFRCLKQKVDEYKRCMRKCSEQEQECIERVLNIMNLGVAEDASAEAVAVSAPAESSVHGSSAEPARYALPEEASKETLELALVPVSRPKPEAKSDLAVFQRILSKNDSISSVEGQASASLAPASKAVGAMPGKRKLTARDVGMCVMPAPSTPSSSAFSPVPKKKASKAKASFVPRAVAAAPAETAAAELGDLGLDGQDLDIIGSALWATVPAGKKKGIEKKPAGGKSASAKPAAKTKASSKPAAKAKASGKKKCSFRHRMTSAAYHKEKSKYLKLGHSKEIASKMARAASQAVADRISRGDLKEEP